MSAWSIVILLISLAILQHGSMGQSSGSGFLRPLNSETIPACRPYNVQWQPTTPNNISLKLFRSHLEKSDTETSDMVATLATGGIPNSGSFIWTPSGGLQLGATSTARFSLRLSDDVTGEYHDSPKFALSKGLECPASDQTFMAATSTPSTSSTPVSSLAPGEKAGIALGAIFGVAILAGLAFLAYRKRKSRNVGWLDTEPKAELDDADEAAELPYYEVRELEGRPMNELASQPASELASQPISELASQPISELASPVPELEGRAKGTKATDENS